MDELVEAYGDSIEYAEPNSTQILGLGSIVPPTKPKQTAEERRESKRLYMQKYRQLKKTRKELTGEIQSMRGLSSPEERKAARRHSQMKYTERKMQRFADAAIDVAVQNLFTSAVSSQRHIASDTVIPGSPPGKKPDELIEGQQGCHYSSRSPSSETSGDEQSVRGPVCPTATSDECHCMWKCCRLSEPEWSKTYWPTQPKLDSLKLMLEGLVCRLHMEPPGTDINLEAIDFLPLPVWASRSVKRHPFLPCVDLDICQWSAPDFTHGLQLARDQIHASGTKKIKQFVELFLDTASGNEKLKETIRAGAKTLDMVEDRIIRLTGKELSSKTAQDLVDFTQGLHLGFILHRAKQAWSFPYKEQDPIDFMKTLMSEVDKERKNIHYCREWLTHKRSLDYPCLTAVIESSLPLRLQKICYLVDSIREFCFGWENHRHRYMNGMCIHEIGWMQRPQKVVQIVLEIFESAFIECGGQSTQR